MTIPLIVTVVGLAVLIFAAERFLDGAVGLAEHFGIPPLVIGMVIVGFGTSAPELVVSAMSALDGSPGIALGNAYGSNIANIALIVGTTALISPIAVHSGILRKELPLLMGVTLIAGVQLWDGWLSRLEGGVLLVLFAAVMGWMMWTATSRGGTPSSTAASQSAKARRPSASSRMSHSVVASGRAGGRLP